MVSVPEAKFSEDPPRLTIVPPHLNTELLLCLLHSVDEVAHHLVLHMTAHSGEGRLGPSYAV